MKGQDKRHVGGQVDTDEKEGTLSLNEKAQGTRLNGGRETTEERSSKRRSVTEKKRQGRAVGEGADSESMVYW